MKFRFQSYSHNATVSAKLHTEMESPTLSLYSFYLGIENPSPHAVYRAFIGYVTHTRSSGIIFSAKPAAYITASDQGFSEAKLHDANKIPSRRKKSQCDDSLARCTHPMYRYDILSLSFRGSKSQNERKTPIQSRVIRSFRKNLFGVWKQFRCFECLN